MEFAVDIERWHLVCTIVPMGRDVALSIAGGDAPHIGCTVMAIPRPSLTGTGRSATVSTLNRTGHKDDFVATRTAEIIARERDCVVSCTCGIHIDQAPSEAIAAIAAAPETIAREACRLLDGNTSENPDCDSAKEEGRS